jgi:hypothetical protein
MKPDFFTLLRTLRRNRAIPGPSPRPRSDTSPSFSGQECPRSGPPPRPRSDTSPSSSGQECPRSGPSPRPRSDSFTLLRALRLPLLRQVTAAALFASLLLQSTAAVAPTPSWWGTQSVLNPNAIADDFAAANVGQLKYFAAKAAAEMNAQLSGGAGSAINALMAAWNTPPATGVTRDDYAALTAGQLKAVAGLFYDRLAAAGAGTQGVYPWGGSGTVADDYAVVNVGQLKAVFAFDVPHLVTTTGSGGGIIIGGGSTTGGSTTGGSTTGGSTTGGSTTGGSTTGGSTTGGSTTGGGTAGSSGGTGTGGSGTTNQGSGDKKDDDGDGIPNEVETNLGLDPEESNADADLDGDSYTDVEEYLGGSDIFDQKSRPGPAILALQKYYGFVYDETQLNRKAPKFKTFEGEANNVDFDESFILINDKGDGNATDRGDEVRSAFVKGSFGENKGMPQYPQILYGNEEPQSIYCTCLSKGTFTREAWGWATRFSITGATINNPPAVPWTRIYLVKKYTGDPKDYANEGDLLFGDIVGCVVFNQDEKGNQSVTYQPSDSSASDSAIINDGQSVVFMPPQVKNFVTSYRLTPIRFEIKQPQIKGDGTIGDFIRVRDIRPTRWFDAFDQSTSKFLGLSNDRDRVRINFVPSSPFPNLTVKVGVEDINGTSTDDTSDDATGITLPTGDFIDNHFVTDSADDKNSTASGGPDDFDLDSTHLSSFGSKVRFEIQGMGSKSIPIKVPMKKPDGSVKVKIIPLNDGTMINTDQLYLKNDINVTHEIYTQIGVNVIQEGAAMPVTPPDNIKSLYADGILSSDELPTFYDWLSPTIKGQPIPVYYIPAKIKLLDNNAVLREARGFSVSLPLRIKGSIVISVIRRDELTLAHEVGHSLGLKHAIEGVRIVHRLMTDLGTQNLKRINDSKRFSPFEEDTIKAGRYFYVPSP